jgi:hypothetical protein
MEFMQSFEQDLTEKLMVVIKPHLKELPAPQENHHYNRCYEAVLGALVERFTNQR